MCPVSDGEHAAGKQGAARETQPEWSVRTAESVMAGRAILGAKWAYEWGVLLKALEGVWHKTHDEKYLDYIQMNVDYFVGPRGAIRTYDVQEYNLDCINPGKLLFPLYEVTGNVRYTDAAHRLRRQLDAQPRTGEGGFWHKLIYPHQMWLDGVYMAGPFYAEYGRVFGESANFDDVARQILLIEKHTRDPHTGLLYHGWDESKTQRWAHPDTGCSPSFWGRAMGWYAMALADVLDLLPERHPRREEIIAVFKETVAALAAVQDPATGLWYQVLDKGGQAGNYLEASASCMFVYAIAKAVRRGTIDAGSLPVARRGYQGILERFVEVDERGAVNLNGICSVAGLGGDPYRDGSFAYYISEKVVTNDYKGLGPFIMASLEMEALGR